MLEFFIKNPGATMPAVASHLPVTSTIYGTQRAVSSAIASLRRKGWLVDCANRCPECGGAQTRGQRNVPIYATVEL